MQHKPRIYIIAIVAVLSGCTSLPSNAPSYTRAPNAPDGYATVYIYRVEAYPKLRKPDVFVSNEQIFAPPELGYTWIHVKAGNQPFRIEWPWDTKWPALSFSQEAIAGQSYYVKISGSFEMNGLKYTMGSSARLIAEDKAQVELKGCCKYIRPKVERIP